MGLLADIQWFMRMLFHGWNRNQQQEPIASESAIKPTREGWKLHDEFHGAASIGCGTLTLLSGLISLGCNMYILLAEIDIMDCLDIRADVKPIFSSVGLWSGFGAALSGSASIVAGAKKIRIQIFASYILSISVAIFSGLPKLIISSIGIHLSQPCSYSGYDHENQYGIIWVFILMLILAMCEATLSIISAIACGISVMKIELPEVQYRDEENASVENDGQRRASCELLDTADDRRSRSRSPGPGRHEEEGRDNSRSPRQHRNGEMINPARSPRLRDHSRSPAPGHREHSRSPAPGHRVHSRSPAPGHRDHSRSPAPGHRDHSRSPAPGHRDPSRSPVPSGPDGERRPYSRSPRLDNRNGRHYSPGSRSPNRIEHSDQVGPERTQERRDRSRSPRPADTNIILEDIQADESQAGGNRRSRRRQRRSRRNRNAGNVEEGNGRRRMSRYQYFRQNTFERFRRRFIFEFDRQDTLEIVPLSRREASLKIIAICRLILGFFIMVMGAVVMVKDNDICTSFTTGSSYTGAGLWCGICTIAASTISIMSTGKSSKWIISNYVLTAVQTCTFTTAYTVISMTGIMESQADYKCMTHFGRTMPVERGPLRFLYICSLVLSLILLGMDIASAALSGYPLCCKRIVEEEDEEIIHNVGEAEILSDSGPVTVAVVGDMVFDLEPPSYEELFMNPAA